MNQVFLGGEKFVEDFVKVLDGGKALTEIPSSQHRRKPLSLEEYDAKGVTRDNSIALAYASGGYTQKEIGDYFGLHYTRISRIIKKAKSKT